MSEPTPAIARGDAVLVVDVQKDFCPGGALPVPDGDAVVPVLNRWIERAAAAGAPVYASRDWHPEGHVSFKEQGGPWPPHCVQDSDGARFHPALRLPADATVVSKGADPGRDQYSAFDGTGLADRLRRADIRRLWVGGLARDVCVRASVLDACAAGFDVRVIDAAAKPITPEGGRKADAEMREAGAVLL